MSVYVVSADYGVKALVTSTAQFFLPAGDPLAGLFNYEVPEAAEQDLRRAAKENRLPLAVILDPETKYGGANGIAARTPSDLLDLINEQWPSLPVVMVMPPAGTKFDIAPIMHPQVWGWDMTPDQHNQEAREERLVAVLRTATGAPTKRRLCATVHFDRDGERLSIIENGMFHFRDRPLLKDGPKRRLLHNYANDEYDLEAFANLREDIARAWEKFSDIGRNMFMHLFEEEGPALIDRSTVDSLEFRFEINPRSFTTSLRPAARVAHLRH